MLREGVDTEYVVKVGETAKVRLPKIPMTAETQFVQLVTETDEKSAINKVQFQDGEGDLAPEEVEVKALSAGEAHLFVRAVDVLTNEDVPDVQPLDITIRVV